MWQQEQDDVQFFAPIVAKKDCRIEIDAVESDTWTVKAASEGGAPGYAGERFPAMKMTLTIQDDGIQTEIEGARPRLTLEHRLNLARYPYLDKKSGELKWMGRSGLYELEEALGFDPVFINGAGDPVEPFITRTGRKVAPRSVEGVKRQPNASFLSAYFNADGTPNLEWAGKIVYADVDIERSEQFGDKNVIRRFKPVPVTV